MLLKSINPASGEIVREYAESQWEEIDNIIKDVNTSYKSWRKTKIAERIDRIQSLARILDFKKEGLAFTISIEMGKPIVESRAEIDKCIWLCNYYCENIDSFLENKQVATEASESYISFQPLGVILAIMPWNFPFWQVFRFAVPAILAAR